MSKIVLFGFDFNWLSAVFIDRTHDFHVEHFRPCYRAEKRRDACYAHRHDPGLVRLLVGSGMVAQPVNGSDIPTH